MNDNILNLSMVQVASAYIFVVILILVVRLKGIPREMEILIASVRMTLQLILTGYVLVYLIETASPWLTLLVLALMEGFAIFTIIRRSKNPMSASLKRIVALSMAVGATACLLYFLFVVVRISPWYDARYFVPIAGMFVGNTMTGVSLGLMRLTDGVQQRKDVIEGTLMLGATPQRAVKPILDNAFDSAILPTINSMLGMGIVFLPGMMTGQILSGTSPVTAISYQIAIMLGILGCVSLTVLLFLQLGSRTFFNDDAQLVIRS